MVAQGTAIVFLHDQHCGFLLVSLPKKARQTRVQTEDAADGFGFGGVVTPLPNSNPLNFLKNDKKKKKEKKRTPS